MVTHEPDPHKPADIPGKSSVHLPLVSAAPSPLHHHVVIALSIILIVAAIAQAGTWLVNTRMLSTPTIESSSAFVHGLLFNGLEHGVDRLSQQSPGQPRIMFVVCLMIALLSATIWYAAVRTALGPAWALWAGIFWVTHPAYAFFAQRPTSLTLLMLLVPIAWLMLLIWRRAGSPMAALLAGIAIGLIALISIKGFTLFVVIMAAMLVQAGIGRKAFVGILAAGIGFVIPLATALLILRGTTVVSNTQKDLSRDLWQLLAMGDDSLMAQKGNRRPSQDPEGDSPSALRFMAESLKNSPRTTVAWYGRRVWRTLHATADGRFKRPLLVLQCLWLVPALWGWIVALKHPPWRWPAGTAAVFVAVTWITAAFAEPLARNLTPVGSLVVLLGLVGMADVYERVFGRRLTQVKTVSVRHRLGR